MAGQGEAEVCPPVNSILMSGLWLTEGLNIEDINQFMFSVLIMQTLVILGVTLILAHVIKPYGQPHIVAELLSGIVLGPTAIGRISYRSTYVEVGAERLETPVLKSISKFIFPDTSSAMTQAIGFFGLIYYVFLIAVEIDVRAVKATGKKVLAVSAAGVFLPMLVTAFAIAIFPLPAPMANSSFKPSRTDQFAFALLLASALSVTSFPILARVLAEVKIPNPEVGQVVLPAAMIGNVVIWVVLAVLFAFTGPANESAAPMWMVLAGAAFVLVCVYVIRPLLNWLVRKTPDGEPVNNVYMGLVLILVLAAALVSSVIGFHPVFGALVLGLTAPKGKLTSSLVERLDSFVIGFMLPFLVIMSGVDTDVFSILTPAKNEPAFYLFWLICAVVVATLAKVAGSVFILSMYSMPCSQGMSLGVLMNTMGPAEIIILNMGKHTILRSRFNLINLHALNTLPSLIEQVFNKKIHTMLLVASLVSTVMVAPLVAAFNRKSSHLVVYKQRSLQLAVQDTDLRVVACIHTIRNVPSIVSLLQLSNPSNQSRLLLYAVHLVELTSRTPPMLMVHDAFTSRESIGGPADHVHSEQIISAIEKYQKEAPNACVTPITAISPFSSMFNDICNVAESCRATLIILPFHKMLTVDGEMEDINYSIRTVNEDVLADSPCSVAILVDRGLSDTSRFANAGLHVGLLFFGGPDDREALLLACRFVDHPGVELTVIRFVPSGLEDRPTADMISAKAEQLLDNEYIREFRIRYASDTSVMYVEKVVSDCTETVAAIRSMDVVQDLYVVGRSCGGDSPLVAGMIEFTEYPELGPIGDYLVSADFPTTVSLLVVQQHVGEGRAWGSREGGSGRKKRSLRRDGYMSTIWDRTT
ncbi:cation/H(+) antiporter 15-like [Canna indica]|uniref:Cation/H(+) antiporter 15-like n=1 Tax=Canna indica TaxID=4628 RepID=A0AAQ3QMK3_9LILI|nr:cation/H(+) antiporter 15-like [Canna indica]